MKKKGDARCHFTIQPFLNPQTVHRPTSMIQHERSEAGEREHHSENNDIVKRLWLDLLFFANFRKFLTQEEASHPGF